MSSTWTLDKTQFGMYTLKLLAAEVNYGETCEFYKILAEKDLFMKIHSSEKYSLFDSSYF